MCPRHPSCGTTVGAEKGVKYRRYAPRDEWLDLARKVDWDYSHVSEKEAFLALISGTPWLPTANGRTGTNPSAPHIVKVVFKNRVLEPRLRLEQVGMEALDRFDVVPEDGHGLS